MQKSHAEIFYVMKKVEKWKSVNVEIRFNRKEVF